MQFLVKFVFLKQFLVIFSLKAEDERVGGRNRGGVRGGGQELTTSDERVGGLPFLGHRVEGAFLDGKKEKIEDNSVKRSILTTFGAPKAQKTLKTRLNSPYKAVKGI
jgi:hypothetical protein